MTADLPYAGTSGWSGTDTSEQRARDQDASGTTAQRQAQAIAVTSLNRERGLTVAEFREMLGVHHGAASAALSALHKVGKLARLTEVRGRCHVYVAPEFINARETQPHGRSDTITITTERYESLVSKAESYDRLMSGTAYF